MARQARGTAQLIAASPEAGRVGRYGGIFAHSDLARELFTRQMAALAPETAVCRLEVPPELGALIHLFKKRMLHVSAAKSTLEERDESWLPVLLEKYPIREGDVLISISNSGRNAVPVLLAKEALERGAYVITLTSMQHTSAVTSRNSLNLRLFETADLVLDNGGVLGDVSFRAADGSMVGPTSTSAGG